MALLSRATPLMAPDGFACLAIPNGVYAATLSGAATLDYTYPNLLALDPGGAHRDVTLPAEATSTGLWYFIANKADAGENLVVKDDAAATVVTVNQNEGAVVYCDGTAWALFAVITIAIS